MQSERALLKLEPNEPNPTQPSLLLFQINAGINGVMGKACATPTALHEPPPSLVLEKPVQSTSGPFGKQGPTVNTLPRPCMYDIEHTPFSLIPRALQTLCCDKATVLPVVDAGALGELPAPLSTGCRSCGIGVTFT